MGKRGRPAKSGPRHPSGQLVQAADRDAVAIRRIIDDAARLGLNPLVATQLGRLAVVGALAPHEAEAGFRVAEIYGRYDRAMGRRRSAASPAYETGRGSDAAAQESSSQAERSRRAVRAFGALQAALRLCPRGVRGPIEELCVEDRVCPAGWLPAVKTTLGILAVELGLRAPPRATAVRPASGQQQVFASIARNLADMDEEKAAALWNHFKMLLAEEEYQRARRDRERLRRQSRG